MRQQGDDPEEIPIRFRRRRVAEGSFCIFFLTSDNFCWASCILAREMKFLVVTAHAAQLRAVHKRE